MKYVRPGRKLNSNVPRKRQKKLSLIRVEFSFSVCQGLVCLKVARKLDRFSKNQRVRLVTNERKKKKKEKQQLSHVFLIHFVCDKNFSTFADQIDGDNTKLGERIQKKHTQNFIGI